MTEAYQTLTDDDVRMEYDRARRGAQPDDRAKQEQAAREVARDNYRAGQHLLRKGQFVKALPYLENAVKADGGSPIYREALGAVQSLNPRLKVEAETHLKKAIDLNRSGATAYLKLGLHYARYGRAEEARTFLKQALSWDSHCEPARMLLPTLDGPSKVVAEGATQVLKELLQGAGAGAAG
jgi:tetratricopeptide (TPR) repeat protein